MNRNNSLNCMADSAPPPKSARYFTPMPLPLSSLRFCARRYRCSGPAPALPDAARRAGFTLIELLAAIAVISILSMILIPAVGRMRDSANLSSSVANMRHATQSMLMYTTGANNGQLPSANGYTQNNVTVHNWVVRMRDEGYADMVGTAATRQKAMLCPIAMLCREDANTNSVERGFAMNTWASNQHLSSIEAPSKMALMLVGRWNPAGRNWNQTEIGAGNGSPNYLPDFPWPIRRMGNQDAPTAGNPNPSTLVGYVDGHVALVAKDEFPDPATGAVTYENFWGRPRPTPQ